jgi:hypothetical protein
MEQTKKNGRVSKRGKGKYASYRAKKTREKNKVKRIRKSNGLKAAILYARLNGVKAPGD